MRERMESVEILDALVDTEHWLNWTRYFGPLSGFDAKVKRPRERYALTAFCYGTNLGPVQTARSVPGTDRFKLAFINQRHVTEASLNDPSQPSSMLMPNFRCSGFGDRGSRLRQTA